MILNRFQAGREWHVYGRGEPRPLFDGAPVLLRSAELDRNGYWTLRFLARGHASHLHGVRCVEPGGCPEAALSSAQEATTWNR